MSLPVVSLFLFLRVWRRVARDGHVIREGGRGSKTTATPTCAKFSDSRGAGWWRSKSGLAISRPTIFSSQRGASCISRGRAQRQSGLAPERAARLASLRHPVWHPGAAIGPWTSSPGCKCVIHVDGRREQNRLGFGSFSWEAQSRNRPARRGTFSTLDRAEREACAGCRYRVPSTSYCTYKYTIWRRPH